MYNWIIINTIGFFTGLISGICIKFICKSFYPIMYNHYYGMYATIQVLAGSYMGYTVCEWYREQVSRYRIARQSNLISVQWVFPPQPNKLYRSQCLEKIYDAKMD